MSQSAVLPPLTCLADYEAAATARLSDAARAYFTGGAGDEVTLAANRRALDRLQLVPRVLRRVAGGSTAVTLWDRTLAHPVLLAPVAYQRMAHPDGEIGTAMAATALDTDMVLSCQSSTALEDVRARGNACRWFQLYLQPERSATLALVRRAEAAGIEALVITVDAPLSGVRNREMRAGFALPDGIRPVMLDALPRPPLPEGPSRVFDGFMAQAPDWEDISWLRGETRLKIVLKGILHPDDAREAARRGADAVIVSNHGGRVLDSAVPTIAALPGIVQAVPGIPVLVDGGLRRGTDVVKSLALGARAVLIGRPVVEALAVNGARGVAHMLRILRDEIEVTMALCGCASVDEITAKLLARPVFDQA